MDNSATLPELVLTRSAWDKQFSYCQAKGGRMTYLRTTKQKELYTKYLIKYKPTIIKFEESTMSWLSGK